MPNFYKIFLILIIVSIASWYQYAKAPSADLLATWMAGKYFGDGVLDQIYSAEAKIFTMRPPSDWLPYLRANGYNGAIYPFIYPPIWAWVSSIFHQVTDFEKVISVASFLNPLMMGSMIWLAVRMVAQKLSPLSLFLITLMLFSTSVSALVALEENQPQILVAFLIVLGVERTRFGSPVIGGIAMAIAASLKLYPVIFALVWLAQGERRAVAAFTLFGGAVGVASIVLTGWPLHLMFLDQIRTISTSVLVTYFSFSIDATVAQHFFSDQLQQVLYSRVLEPGEVASGWGVLSKPTIWRWMDAALIVAVIAVLFNLARGKHSQDPLIWPIAFTLLALVSPLSWGYHYIAGLAFASALFERMPLRFAGVALCSVFLPISTFYYLVGFPGLPTTEFAQPLGTLAMALYVMFLWLAIRKVPYENTSALAPITRASITPDDLHSHAAGTAIRPGAQICQKELISSQL